MYDYFEGRLVTRRPTSIVIDVGGVGYELAVPLGAHFSPVGGPETDGRGEATGRVRVWSHLAVREDAQDLYGFPTTQMRELFRLLLKVRGVGPGLALAVLSSLPGDELRVISQAIIPVIAIRIGIGRTAVFSGDLRTGPDHPEVGCLVAAVVLEIDEMGSGWVGTIVAVIRVVHRWQIKRATEAVVEAQACFGLHDLTGFP